MRQAGPPLLLINPWIYDFAAYDFFAQPLGLLYLAGLLMGRGYEVHYLDCLGEPHGRIGAYGTGRYRKEILPTPSVLAGVPRHWGRYGLPEDACRERLARVPRPAAVLVTSLMTYWYPGVQAAIRLVREQFPGVPVLLGGVYATLCSEHARQHSGADLCLSGAGEGAVVRSIASVMGRADDSYVPGDPDYLPYPALHLAPHLYFIPILTSRGCPFRCSYCASHLLNPRYQRRQPLAVVEELLYWQDSLQLIDVAFYDDALLLEAERHLLVILEELARRGRTFRFHTPNALHAKYVTLEVARWLKKANFATLRLGVETTALGEGRRDEKLGAGELEMALANLSAAGFRQEEVGVYLLLGLPGQQDEEIEVSVRRVRELGATPILAQYSPVPGTSLWPEAREAARYELAADPLFQNNSIFPCWPEFSWERFSRLKRLAEGR